MRASRLNMFSQDQLLIFNVQYFPIFQKPDKEPANTQAKKGRQNTQNEPQQTPVEPSEAPPKTKRKSNNPKRSNGELPQEQISSSRPSKAPRVSPDNPDNVDLDEVIIDPEAVAQFNMSGETRSIMINEVVSSNIQPDEIRIAATNKPATSAESKKRSPGSGEKVRQKTIRLKLLSEPRGASTTLGNCHSPLWSPEPS